MKTKKKVITFPDAIFFAQNEVKAKKRSDGHHLRWRPVLGHENIGGDAAGLLRGIHPSMDLHPWLWEVRNYRKTLFIQSIVENGWWGNASPTPSLDPPLVLGMLLNVCLLVLRLLFFEKFARVPKAKSINMIWGPHIARVKTNHILNLKIGLFKAPLSYVD